MEAENKLFDVKVIVTDVNGVPALEIRKRLVMNADNKDTFKAILSAAYKDNPVIVMPSFSNKLISIANMIKKGWLEQKENPTTHEIQYKFLF